MLQSVSLSALQPAAANPRRKIDRKAIEGLAASIRTDGLLHNLVVKPVQGKRNRFAVSAPAGDDPSREESSHEPPAHWSSP